MKNIAILGSTGSIGTQALEIIRQNPGIFKAVALSCGKNTELLKEQIEEFKSRFPDCEVNTTASNPTGDGWRGKQGYAPRYKLLREQFCYYYPSISYSAFDVPPPEH